MRGGRIGQQINLHNDDAPLHNYNGGPITKFDEEQYVSYVPPPYISKPTYYPSSDHAHIIGHCVKEHSLHRKALIQGSNSFCNEPILWTPLDMISVVLIVHMGCSLSKMQLPLDTYKVLSEFLKCFSWHDSKINSRIFLERQFFKYQILLLDQLLGDLFHLFSGICSWDGSIRHSNMSLAYCHKSFIW